MNAVLQQAVEHRRQGNSSSAKPNGSAAQMQAQTLLAMQVQPHCRQESCCGASSTEI